MYPFDCIPEGKKAVRKGATWEIVDLDPADKMDAVILLEQAKLKIAQLEAEVAVYKQQEQAQPENPGEVQSLKAENETLREDVTALTEEVNTLRAKINEASVDEEVRPRKIRDSRR